VPVVANLLKEVKVIVDELGMEEYWAAFGL